MKIRQNTKNAFTLAELLISLAILGIIATFTIPKVLQNQQDSKYTSITKESASAMVGAFQAYTLRNSITGTLSGADLTPFLNYVSAYSGSIDAAQGGGTINCNWTQYFCLKLHNGAVIEYTPSEPFGGTASTDAIYFYVDPDGGTTGGPGKSVPFFLYTTGRLTTWGNLLPGTKVNGGGYSADPTKDPPWFSWN